MHFTDQELASEIRGGSQVAFEQLMLRYRRLVFRVAYGFTRDRESALDATQETFLKVHARIGDWRGEGELRNWIARIAAHESLSLERSRQRRPTCELDESVFLRPDPAHDERLWRRDLREALDVSLGALSPRQRLAVVLRYFQDMSPQEISGVLACSEGTARNILFRSLQKLRTVMTASEEALP